MAFVYVLQSGEDHVFKIGRTRGDIEKRRKELSTGNPKPLTVFDFIETEHDALVEHYLHTKFRPCLSTEGDAKEFYVIEPETLRQGLEEARAFLVEYLPLYEQAESYKHCEPTETVKEPDEEVIELYKKLCVLRAEIDGLTFEKQILENKLKSKIGDAEGIEGIATWQMQTRIALDQKKLKEQHPEIYEAFLKEQKSRVFRLL